MPIKHKILTTALSLFCATLTVAQDSDTLALPLFDDFSYNGTEPDNSLWQNNGVTLSNTLPNRPPSIGVAVFDALDINGEFYPSQYGTKYASGDTLTSKPIDLYYPGDNTIFLSFFYQPGVVTGFRVNRVNRLNRRVNRVNKTQKNDLDRAPHSIRAI